jgi:hypothetical protein
MTPAQIESAISRENSAALKLLKSEADCAQQFSHYMRDAWMDDDRIVIEWLAFFSGWHYCQMRQLESKNCEVLHVDVSSRKRR